MKIIPSASKNFDLAKRWNRLRLISSRFSSLTSLFWLFFRLRCEVMDPCFIHGYDSIQKLAFIAAKHHQTLDPNIPTTLFLFHYEQTRTHIGQSFLMSKFSVHMPYTALFKLPFIPASSCSFSPRLSNTILLICSPFLAWSPHLVDHCNVRLDRSWDPV